MKLSKKNTTGQFHIVFNDVIFYTRVTLSAPRSDNENRKQVYVA